MKVITHGTIPPPPPDWRLMVVNRCPACGAEWQFEDPAEEVKYSPFTFFQDVPAGRFRNIDVRDDAGDWKTGIESLCPTCGALTTTYEPDDVRTLVRKCAAAFVEAMEGVTR